MYEFVRPAGHEPVAVVTSQGPHRRQNESNPQRQPRVFERIAAGDPGDPQDGALASYAGFFEDDYSPVDWSRPADELHCQVRAWSSMFGYGRGAVADIEGQSVRIVRSRVERGVTEGSPGEVVRRESDAVLVRCGEDALWVLETADACRD
jgi:methionyl-tRNA formyltransferase